MISEEIKAIKSDESELKKFGITIGLILICIALLMIYNGNYFYPYVLSIGLLFIVLGYFFQIVLKPLHKIWMAIAVILGWISTRIILSILFYLIITPMSLIAKLLGKDLLDEKIERQRESYWRYRKNTEIKNNDIENQF